MTTLEQFQKLLKRPEGLHLEFKEARSSFSKDKDLPDYCAALANEGGGKLILGVNDQGKVVGTKAFERTFNKLPHELLHNLKIRVDIEELLTSEGRVLIFHIPSRPIGQRIRSTSKHYLYPMRAGESLVEMDDRTTKRILDEATPDFSAQTAEGFRIEDIDPSALKIIKRLWAEKSKRPEYLGFGAEKTLRNLGLMSDQGLNYACLILLGKKSVLDKLLPDAEIIFEWRNVKGQTHYDYRKNWREPFVAIDEEIWATVNNRNLVIPFQEGFFQRDILAFDEKSIREAVHNAVIHRNYSLKGRSVFILASPQEFSIESPGGFLPGITPENALFKKEWRNRALAEAFQKIGLAERSSQGLDDIFEKSIRDGKGLPDLSKSDEFTVQLVIPAQVKDKDFILFLENIVNKLQIHLSFEEIYELEKVRELQKLDNPDFRKKFLKLGLIESIGSGRGTKYILSHRYYASVGKSGLHTRLKGLSRKQIKELILNHISEGKPSRVQDLISGFPECKPQDISNILQELKQAGKIFHEGSKLKGAWRLKAPFIR